MNPKEIRFSQDSISETFNGPDGWSIWKLFDDIYDGRLDIARPTLMISVVFQDGHYFVEEGNRRLYIYKLLEDLDKINKIQVAEQFENKNSKNNEEKNEKKMEKPFFFFTKAVGY